MKEIRRRERYVESKIEKGGERGREREKLDSDDVIEDGGNY